MKGQHFFAAKIVKPLWEPFVALFPALEHLLVNLNTNCDYYQQEASRLEKQRVSSVPPRGAGGGDNENNNNNNGGEGEHGN
ncbi:unnamed protein product [Laminaria digitata]